MAGQESIRKSGRRAKPKGKKRTTNNGTVNRDNNNNTVTRDRERTVTNTLPRLDAVEKVPSNAPTMAIAPSDYEHIFHEATGIVGRPASPPTKYGPGSPTSPAAPRTPEPDYGGGGGGAGAGAQNNYPNQARVALTPPPPPLPAPPTQRPEPLLVSPDGYTMLGHAPDANPHRRVALPAYIVRASNQFSRAALARVARYLASRADPPR